MLQMIKNRFLGYVHIHRRTYYIISLLFCVGVICGVIFSALLSDMRQQEIENFVQSYCRTSAADGVNASDSFYTSLTQNLKITAVLFLCSVSSLFIPVSGFMVMSEGFTIGFTVGSLTRIFGVRGFALAAAAIFPGAIIAVPVIIHLACCSVYYALERRKRPELAADRSVMLRFCAAAFICLIILFLSSLVEGYVSPVFVKSISGLF